MRCILSGALNPEHRFDKQTLRRTEKSPKKVTKVVRLRVLISSGIMIGILRFVVHGEPVNVDHVRFERLLLGEPFVTNYARKLRFFAAFVFHVPEQSAFVFVSSAAAGFVAHVRTPFAGRAQR